MSPDTTPSNFRVQGCPAADGTGECPRCVPYMSGWDTDKLTAEVVANKQLPVGLCGVLRGRVEAAGGTVAPVAKKHSSKSTYRRVF